MTQPKPTIPEVIERFAEYVAKPGNGAWGSLHIVLDDFNVKDDDVRFCVEWAEELGDTEGAELARVLLRMSRTQRSKIGPMASDMAMRRVAYHALASQLHAVREQPGECGCPPGVPVLATNPSSCPACGKSRPNWRDECSP